MLYSSQIKSRQPAVTEVVSNAETALLKAHLDPDQTGEVCLVLAEALNNVVEHAYQYAEDGEIDVELALVDERVSIKIIDFGPAFRAPLGKDIGPEDEALDQLPEGGFGWGLIEMLTDEITLNRIDDKNHLVLCKKVTIQ